MKDKGKLDEEIEIEFGTFCIKDPDSPKRLEFRVGPVTFNKKQHLGIWIEDQNNILACISMETWNKLNKHIQERYIKWEKSL